MIENKALVQACLLKVDAGAWDELETYQVEVLQTAGLIQPFDVFPHTPLEHSPSRFEYKLTQAGRDTLWPPEK